MSLVWLLKGRSGLALTHFSSSSSSSSSIAVLLRLANAGPVVRLSLIAACHRCHLPQVIADKLLEAAARDKAAYQNPYDEPTYAVQLAKVEAKAAREAARAAAAVAKAARWGKPTRLSETFSWQQHPSHVECSACWVRSV